MSGLPFEFPKTDARFVDRARRAAGALRRRFGRGIPATDIVHEVMLEALEEQVRTGSAAKGFWRRLVNKVFDNYRREQAHLRMIGRRAAEQQNAGCKRTPDLSGEDGVIEHELRARIDRAVAELSATDQEIWRRLGLSESYDEIAQALGKTPSAVRQAAYRIRSHVRGRLPREYRMGTGSDE